MDINRSAPAMASAEGVIHAPPELVWAIQSDFETWPAWNAAVTRMRLDGPVAPGTSFRWTAGGAPIRSTIQEVVPGRRLVWTGRMPGIRAVHVWHFEPHPEGTRVRTEESFEGVLVRWLAGPMQRMLAASLAQGLAALKAEAEKAEVERQAARQG
ncbi:hypothetical protein AWN76_011635 [Rhodothermaceae bacterium RA]|nr:hypothetical protein AWN76_011635 [Rhodothermaceae bacterium RA]